MTAKNKTEKKTNKNNFLYIIIAIIILFFLLLFLTNRSVKYNITTESTLDDFLEKPSVILFVGTYCGHCNIMVPEYKTKIWKDYKEKANLWVNVIDNKKFNVSGIAQGYNINLNYDLITGDKCMYIPSFIVLDKYGEIVLKSCGGEKDIDDIKETLDRLLE